MSKSDQTGTAENRPPLPAGDGRGEGCGHKPALDAKTVKEAAQICGLGAPGLAGFILTPEFGPMQRFAFVLTDAELEPDPVCETSLCGAACQRACLAHLEAKGVLTRAFTNAFRP